MCLNVPAYEISCSCSKSNLGFSRYTTNVTQSARISNRQLHKTLAPLIYEQRSSFPRRSSAAHQHLIYFFQANPPHPTTAATPFMPAVPSTWYISFYYNIFSPVICVRVRGIPSSHLLHPANLGWFGNNSSYIPHRCHPTTHLVRPDSPDLLPSSPEWEETSRHTRGDLMLFWCWKEQNGDLQTVDFFVYCFNFTCRDL